MTALRPYRPDDLGGLAAVWNRTFRDGPNFIPLTEVDLVRRIVRQPSFDPGCLLVAASSEEVRGFVHYGPLTNFWYELSARRVEPTGGQIWAVAAPTSEDSLCRDLLQEVVGRLTRAGVSRILLYPSWVQSAQPFYNGIAGGYESPGLSAARDGLLTLAADQGFSPIAEYGTPELGLSDADHLDSLRAAAAQAQARLGGGLSRRLRRLRSAFFPDRKAVELEWRGQSVAQAAYGLWHEYARAHGRSLFGITGVHVARAWRGMGLGRIVMVRAIEAALAEGAEALHLHVYKDNRPAWNLYHRALGFRPKHTWLTLARDT